MLRGSGNPPLGVWASREWGQGSWEPCLWRRDGGRSGQTPQVRLCPPGDDQDRAPWQAGGWRVLLGSLDRAPPQHTAPGPWQLRMWPILTPG